jgi:hypothetical protein
MNPCESDLSRRLLRRGPSEDSEDDDFSTGPSRLEPLELHIKAVSGGRKLTKAAFSSQTLALFLQVLHRTQLVSLTSI